MPLITEITDSFNEEELARRTCKLRSWIHLNLILKCKTLSCKTFKMIRAHLLKFGKIDKDNIILIPIDYQIGSYPDAILTIVCACSEKCSVCLKLLDHLSCTKRYCNCNGYRDICYHQLSLRQSIENRLSNIPGKLFNTHNECSSLHTKEKLINLRNHHSQVLELVGNMGSEGLSRDYTTVNLGLSNLQDTSIFQNNHSNSESNECCTGVTIRHKTSNNGQTNIFSDEEFIGSSSDSSWSGVSIEPNQCNDDRPGLLQLGYEISGSLLNSSSAVSSTASSIGICDQDPDIQFISSKISGYETDNIHHPGLLQLGYEMNGSLLNSTSDVSSTASSIDIFDRELDVSSQNLNCETDNIQIITLDSDQNSTSKATNSLRNVSRPFCDKSSSSYQTSRRKSIPCSVLLSDEISIGGSSEDFSDDDLQSDSTKLKTCSRSKRYRSAKNARFSDESLISLSDDSMEDETVSARTATDKSAFTFSESCSSAIVCNESSTGNSILLQDTCSPVESSEISGKGHNFVTNNLCIGTSTGDDFMQETCSKVFPSSPQDTFDMAYQSPHYNKQCRKFFASTPAVLGKGNAVDYWCNDTSQEISVLDSSSLQQLSSEKCNGKLPRISKRKKQIDRKREKIVKPKDISASKARTLRNCMQHTDNRKLSSMTDIHYGVLTNTLHQRNFPLKSRNTVDQSSIQAVKQAPLKGNNSRQLYDSTTWIESSSYDDLCQSNSQ